MSENGSNPCSHAASSRENQASTDKLHAGLTANLHGPFRCPYYAFAEQDLTGRLPGIDLSSTGYYGNLTSLTSVNSSVAVQIIDVGCPARIDPASKSPAQYC